MQTSGLMLWFMRKKLVGRIFVSWQQAARIFGMASQNSRLQRMWNTRLRLGFPMPDLGELALLCCYSAFRPGAKALFTRAPVFRKTLTAGQRNKLAGLLPREILLLRFCVIGKLRRRCARKPPTASPQFPLVRLPGCFRAPAVQTPERQLLVNSWNRPAIAGTSACPRLLAWAASASFI